MKRLVRWLVLLALSAIALQGVFVLRIAMMRFVDPESTTFQRSEIWRLATERHEVLWSQRWQPYERIAATLKRAVIASEDASFTDHGGVDWEAIEKAWERNQRAEARAEKLQAQLESQQQRRAANARSAPPRPAPVAKIVGGSTISQQLAKNLFLSGERSLARKGQEFVITFMLEALLDKERILAIYLNNVEWGEGVFGAQAASRHYFRVDAGQLSAMQAARLAVMLPAPKRFEKRPGSAYVSGRAATIVSRMSAVELP
ncbi:MULTISPECIES: transglycosylase domain-containing protein [Methylibium]|uniref:Biosynthetic peptidoglycan transglycosylase n=1 Tax=Methylibium petroleiphilum (strain ATCC BAA-1232 / LMG 22953 / PM1) TaxID=420662 RepID=A2SKR6_METPP|nr:MULTISPECIES: transglycosylase domain-containing protein [Methylibium]ABM96155.1 putative peptidoglycan biosynthesis-related protein [Methylibium petroleiphilum PM1]EWS56018.1 Penicillin-binding protein F [Methylibium sp. T29]EWS60364.1 Penicillin-binding protein F [Methylibium sp. T29-B]